MSFVLYVIAISLYENTYVFVIFLHLFFFVNSKNKLWSSFGFPRCPTIDPWVQFSAKKSACGFPAFALERPGADLGSNDPRERPRITFRLILDRYWQDLELIWGDFLIVY